MNLKDVTVIVLGVLPVIIGVVEFIKKFEVKGKWLTLSSFLVGGLISGLGWAYITFPSLQTYIIAFFVIVIGGMAGSGNYDLVNKRFPEVEK